MLIVFQYPVTGEMFMPECMVIMTRRPLEGESIRSMGLPHRAYALCFN